MIDFIKKLLKKYFGGGVILFSPQVVSLSVNLIALPIVLRSLPIADYGLFQFVLAIQAWVGSLSGNHINTGAIRGISRGLEGSIFYGFLQRLKFFSVVCLAGLIAPCAFYFLGYQTFAILLVLALIYLFFGYLPQGHYSTFLIAKKKFKQLSLWQMVDIVASLSISTTVAYFTRSIVLFAVSFFGVKIFIYLIAWAQVIKENKIIQAYRKGLVDKECFYFGVRLIPIDIISITAGKISDFLIGSLIGFSGLAVFSIANKLRNKVANAIKITPSLLYSDFAEREKKDLIKMVNKYLVKICLSGFLMVLGALIAAYVYIVFFLPVSYHQAILYFAILAFGLPAALMAIILHTILEAHLRLKELTVIGIGPNLLKIALILIFGYFWRIIGVCVALVVSSWISFGFYYLLTVKKDFAIKIVKRFSFLERLSGF